MPVRDKNLSNLAALKDLRRDLREKATRVETLLWHKLRARRFLGKKFRRQYSIGRYVVDFFCDEHKIAIELDGAHHFWPQREDYEVERTAFLEGLGIQIIRFENRVVRENMDAVLETLRQAIERRSGADLPRRADD